MAPLLRLGSSLLALILAQPALGQDRAVTYNLFGTPGLLEMPSALSADEGEIAGTLSHFGGQTRTTFTFQATDRLSGSFRYSAIQDYHSVPEGSDPDNFTRYDRSFDLRYRLADEGTVLPAIAVGLRDFLGTNLYSAEYVVATKTLGSAVRVTAGLGWGRLGTYNGFDNPLGLGERTGQEEGDQGGLPSVGDFFRGDAALFGGVEWAPNERWILKAEYSSDDAYVDQLGNPLFERRSPLNFGVTWRPRPGVQLGLGYLYGSQLSFGATVTINPNDRPLGAGRDPAPQPVAVRAEAVRAALPEAELRQRLAVALRSEGVELAAVELGDRSARVRYTNTRFRSEAQAMGRVLRILTHELPPSIERLTLEPVQQGLPLAAATFARSDIEAFENEVGGTAAALARVELDGPGPDAGLVEVPPARPRFAWSLRPTVRLGLFDSENPYALSFGARLEASYAIRPNLVLSGELAQTLVDSSGNLLGRLDEEPQPGPTTGRVPVVRTDGSLYGDDGHPSLSHLTLTRYGHPGRNLYSRVTAGYLEEMYGGLSGELLWKPVESRLGLGLEVNYARKRDYDGLLGFQDYDVVTGHASAYFDFGNGFHGRVDAGRYLAGDWGATFALDREFENGWSVGGFFTLTDIPFEDFGEGSFDKGLSLSIPIDFIIGRPTRRTADNTLRSLDRDGGARLDVEGRLYDIVRDAHYGDLEDTWGRFWR